MSDGCLGYVRGSNKKRLSTEDLDVDKRQGNSKAEGESPKGEAFLMETCGRCDG
jgi:hypothetical protein